MTRKNKRGDLKIASSTNHNYEWPTPFSERWTCDSELFNLGYFAAKKWVVEAPVCLLFSIHDYVLQNEPPHLDANKNTLSNVFWSALLNTKIVINDDSEDLGGLAYDKSAAHLRGLLLGVAEWMADGMAKLGGAA